MANTDAINSFLDQYQGQADQTDANAAPASTTENPAITQFLDQQANVQPAQPPMSPDQAAQMTHGVATKSERIRPRIFGEGIKEGFANLAALPGYAVDLVNWPLNKLGITPDKALGGSDQIRKGWELLTQYQDMQPQNRSEAYIKTVGEFMGGSMLPTGGVLGNVASRGVPVALTGNSIKDATKLREFYNVVGKKGVIGRVSEPATLSDLASVIGVDAASSVTGGVGSEFGGEVGYQAGGNTGELIGRMAFGWSAGMAPIYFKTAGATIWNSVKAAKIITQDRANFLDNIAKNKIIKAIGENPESPEAIKAAAKLQQEIPGLNPSVAAAANSPGLAQIQSRLDMQSIENYNRATENIRKSQEAISNYYKSNFGESATKTAATKVYRQTTKNLKTQVESIDQQIKNVASQYKEQPTGDIGARLRALRAERKAVVKGNVNESYKQLYKAADDLGIVDDAGDLYTLATDFVRQDTNAFQSMPSVYAKMRMIFGREIDPEIPLGDQKIMTDFKQMHSLYREVSSQYGKALKRGDNQSQWYLGQIKELLDGKLAQFDDSIYGSFAAHKQNIDTQWLNDYRTVFRKVYGNFAKRKQAVDKQWLNEYHKVFRQGIGGKMPQETRFGEITPDEKIVSSLVMQEGTTRGLDQFNKIYENMPEAQILLRNGILDMFAKSVIKQGKISSASVETFTRKYGKILDKLPDLRNTFLNSDALTSALANRQADVIAKTSKFASKSISPYAKIAGFDSPKQAVQLGLTEPKVMRVLIRNAKTKQEKSDLTTLIADVVTEQPDPWQYILSHEEQLAKHFNQLKPGHFQKLKNIAESQSILGRYHPNINRGQQPNQDAFYQKFGTTFASALAQWRWALLYGKTSIYYPAADMGAKYLTKISNNQIDQLMERALYDPDLATTMSELTKVRPTNLGDVKVKELIGKLGMHALANGIRVSNVAGSENRNDQQGQQGSNDINNLVNEFLP